MVSTRRGTPTGHRRHGPILGALRPLLPPLNFITIHYAYFIIVCLTSSVIFWGSSEPARSITYADSLFLVVSAMTEAGLNTVNLSEMTSWQQTLLFFLIIIGSSIWVSIWTIVFRKRVFEQRFNDTVDADGVRRTSRKKSISQAGNNTGRSGSWHRLSEILKPSQGPNGAGQYALPVLVQDLSSPGPRRDLSPGGGRYEGRPLNNHDKDQTLTSATTHITFETSGQAAVRHSTNTAPLHSGKQVVRRTATLAPCDSSPQSEKRGTTIGPISSGFLGGKLAGRNAQFHGLSKDQREELGGREYRAIKLLSVLVPMYFVLWQLFGCIALGAWINNHMAPIALANGINPWWLGIFNGASAFNNSGMTLLDANMVPFQNAYFVLITMGMMILAGNTAYPVLLRLILWAGLKTLILATPEDRLIEEKETLQFILKYPRRVYTNLFPSRPTWWLLFMIVLLNCIDWVAFELMNLGNPTVEDIPIGPRILDGLFQAIAVRSGGFYIVPMTEVYIGLQVLYVIMMYISAYPVVITMRHSNVYEERSLGIYSNEPELVASLTEASALPNHTTPLREIGSAIARAFVPWYGVGVPPPPDKAQTSETRISFISQQIHGQLAHDLWWLVLAVLAISTIETSYFLSDPVSYSVFNVIFEVVSAYGCVGISMGVPWAAYSFSGGWHAASKIVLCFVMIRGRHRGLPVALDRAVRLPGEQMHRDEDDDYRIRLSMTSRRLSTSAHAIV